MKKTIGFLLLSLMCSVFATAQQWGIGDKLQSILGNYASFSVDNLNNIYLLSTSNQLKKLSADADSVSVFNDIKKFGEATLIDVSNPVKILMYYKGFSTIAVLDGMLNLKNTIDLRRKNIFSATAVSLSYDGKIWLYDDMDNTLKKLDDEGNTLFQTSDFRQLFGQPISPIKIVDQNRYVYLYDPQQGIYVFDYYGTYKKKIDITEWEQLRIVQNFVCGTQDHTLYQYNIATFNTNEWPIPKPLTGYKQLLYKNGKLYALTDTALEIYSVSNKTN